MNLLLIIGEPATGKTTFVRELVKPLVWSIAKKPFWHTVYYDRQNQPFASQFGWQPEHTQFGGTDQLAFNVIPKAVKLMSLKPYDLIVAEGDRLANATFMNAAIATGYEPEIVVMRVPEFELGERRATRTQDEAWVLGRKSKVQNFARYWDQYVKLNLDGTLDPARQIELLTEYTDSGKRFAEAKR